MPFNRRPTKKVLVYRALLGGITQTSRILRAHNTTQKVTKELADFMRKAKYELRCLKNNPKISDIPLLKIFQYKELLYDLNKISYIDSVFKLSVCDIRVLQLTMKRHPFLPEEILRVLYTIHLGSAKKNERAKKDKLRKEGEKSRK